MRQPWAKTINMRQLGKKKERPQREGDNPLKIKETTLG
jgi:hypothetical protein